MPRKQTIKDIASQLRDPQHINILRELLKRYGKRLQVARLTVKDGYLHYAGTTGQAISYWMRGVNYLRTKGPLDRKAFYKRKCFEGSRKSAKRFALGNELASTIYARVMVSRKTYPLFCFLKKRAILLIKEGKTVEQAEEILTDYLMSFGLIRREVKLKKGDCVKRENRPIENNYARKIFDVGDIKTTSNKRALCAGGPSLREGSGMGRTSRLIIQDDS